MKRIIKNIISISVLALLASCGGSKKTSTLPSSNEPTTPSSSLPEQTSALQSSSSKKDYVDNQLSNGNMVVEFESTGASIKSIKWKNTQIAKDGFVVGRVANRINQGKFTLDGVEMSVQTNDNGNSLHGGPGTGGNSWRGPFATKSWERVSQTSSSIVFKIVSPDGENGYQGQMTMTVTYTLSQAGELSIHYNAFTTKDTLCNPTNHLYMAINGASSSSPWSGNSSSFDNIKLWINADNYTPLGKGQIPTGEVSTVEGTKFDYRVEKAFDKSQDYDDNLVLNGTGTRKVATMTGTKLGVKVDVFTDRPGLQLYKDGNSGYICLETQMMPDAINHPEFDVYGTTILRKGETFESTTTYAFSAVE